jgi:hypothetical protein
VGGCTCGVSTDDMRGGSAIAQSVASEDNQIHERRRRGLNNNRSAGRVPSCMREVFVARQPAAQQMTEKP